MARRSREAIQKRLRERKRVEKAEAKRQKRIERKQGLDPEEVGAETTGELAVDGAPESENGVIATGVVVQPAGQVEPSGEVDEPLPARPTDTGVHTPSD